jgi:fumarylacetoacetate (FAA) hydrolase family protein
LAVAVPVLVDELLRNSMAPPSIRLDLAETLPDDARSANLAGRIWRPDAGGPSVVKIAWQGDDAVIVDICSRYPTMRDLCERATPATAVSEADGEVVGSLADLLANTPPDGRDTARPWLLAPIDLQAVKAAGVTFAVSLLERVIEERARGNPASAAAIRAEIEALVGSDLAALKPGSDKAQALKSALLAKGAWSQYLEVGIGPDAEIFTKAQPMASVGSGMDAGLHPVSTWSNPEPEVVVVVSSTGRIVGACLGNDVNLRDVEGRSALLLGKAKDNNASSAIGPFIRFFDGSFTLDDVRRMDVVLSVEGEDGYRLEGGSSISRISRDPTDLVAQMIGPHHQYPDGVVLFLGTMFAPVADRDAVGRGFTHKPGDIVKVSAKRLGTLTNRMRSTDACEPWVFGTGQLMRNLAGRRLI